MKTLSVENSLIKARSLSKKGNVSEGINILQSILRDFPNNMRVQKALQNLTSSHVDFNDKAIPDFELKNLFKLFKSIQTEKFLFEAAKTYIRVNTSNKLKVTFSLQICFSYFLISFNEINLFF